MALRSLMTLPFVALICWPGVCQADWTTGLPDGIDLETLQIFKVDTQGRAVTQEAPNINEQGTAFAISADALITARHVTRNALEFRNQATTSKVHIPDRNIAVSFATDETPEPSIVQKQHVSVTPAPITTTDAARLNLSSLEVRPFALSACDPKPDEDYFLLKFRGAKLSLPIAVPIEADSEVYTGQGELRRFRHSEADGSDRAPVGGDSGSPVLNANGEVIGLLTAIDAGARHLYVTLTRNWLDLVPQGVRIACDTSVTKDDLADVERALNARVDTIETKIDDLKQEVAAVNLTTSELGATVTSLSEELARVRTSTISTVRAMIAEASDLEDLRSDEAVRIMQALNQVEPVIPAVIRIDEDLVSLAEELSEETWGFHFSTFNRELQLHLFNAEYSREISLPPFKDSLTFCIKPMLPLPDGVNEADAQGSDLVTHRAYYRAAERNPVQTMDQCQAKQHGQSAASKGGKYTFHIDAHLARPAAHPTWNGMFYGLIFDPAEASGGGDGTDPTILHRFVFVADPEDHSAPIECYYFGYHDPARVADDLASFAQNTASDREPTLRCPTL